MTKHGCHECDVMEATIGDYCRHHCEQAKTARELGTPLILKAACAICPLSRPFTVEPKPSHHEHIDKLLAGKLPDPPPATQAKMRRRLSV